MRIKCLQRRLEQSVPKEVFKSLSEAYSKLAASQTRLLARVADAAIAVSGAIMKRSMRPGVVQGTFHCTVQ